MTSLPTEESSEMWPEKLTRPESIPQSGVPITPQPGDTSATWDRSKAEQFPSDDDCTDMELLEKWTAVEGALMPTLTSAAAHSFCLSVHVNLTA